MGVIDSFVEDLSIKYTSLSSSIPPILFLAIKLFFISLFIALSIYVIWLLYKALSKRNFISLNLSKYNLSDHETKRKFYAVVFYFIEYLLFMPALILMWFTAFSLILLFIASNRSINEILMLSGSLVMAIRILAYYKEEIAEEPAKLFPFIALSVFLLTPGIFEINSIIEKIKEVPQLLESIVLYLAFIFIFEIIFRISYTIFQLAKGQEDLEEE